MLTRRPGAKIVFEVKCSQGLVEYLERIGGTPIMWKTGHSLIKAKMKEEGALLAGEMSGHMFFADDYYGFDDALYASLRLLQHRGRHRAHAVRPGRTRLPRYHGPRPSSASTARTTLKFDDRGRRCATTSARPTQVIDIDGARVLFGDGWGLVRASNTQPVLVLRFEARSPERLQAIQAEVMAFLGRFSAVRLEAVPH